MINYVPIWLIYNNIIDQSIVHQIFNYRYQLLFDIHVLLFNFTTNIFKSGLKELYILPMRAEQMNMRTLKKLYVKPSPYFNKQVTTT